MTLRRWACPNEKCHEPDKLAPERARTDDVRTYCLPCSERTCRLVRRVPPAVEKKREVASTRRAEKAKVKRERERAEREREAALKREVELGSLANHPPSKWTATPPDLRPVLAAKTLKHLFTWWASFTPARRAAYRAALASTVNGSVCLLPPSALAALDNALPPQREDPDAPTYPLSVIVDAAANGKVDTSAVRAKLVEYLRADRVRRYLWPVADEIESRAV